MFLNTRNNNIDGFGGGISVVFEIFSNFLFRGGVTPGAISNVLHILPITKETRIYMVQGDPKGHI
jgi:hypothetical protein